MPIPVPPIGWPANFMEQGPAEDPTILLKARADIAGTGFVVTALRVRQDGRLPDYLDDVPEDSYEAAMDALVGDIEDFVGSIDLSLLIINNATYLLWMVRRLARDLVRTLAKMSQWPGQTLNFGRL